MKSKSHFFKCLVLSVVVTAVAFSFILGITAVIAYNRPDLSYNALDYDVTVEEDGNLRIVETVDVRLDKREDDDETVPWRQLYQQYRLRATDLTNISDISVKDLTTGVTYTQMDPVNAEYVSPSSWDQYENHWYIGDVTTSESHPEPFDSDIDGLIPANVGDSNTDPDKTVEIGWNIPTTTSAHSMKFEIGMTWHNVGTSYTDVATFQWEPLGATNRTPIEELTATVKLPDGATKDNSWAWLHYSGQSTTSRDGDTLHFSASDIHAGNYVDLVLMVDHSLVHASRMENSPRKQYILQDEDQQERAWRAAQQRHARLVVAVWIVVLVLGVVLSVFALRNAIRTRKRAQYQGDMEYWREPLDMSPAAAAALYGMLRSESPTKLSNRQLAATLMSLISKGAIAVYPGPSTLYRGIDMSNPQLALQASQQLAEQNESRSRMAKTSTIVIQPVAYQNQQSLRLCESEEAELTLLLKVSKRLNNVPVFDFEQMQGALKSWKKGITYLSAFTDAAADEYKALDATKPSGGGTVMCGILLFIVAITSLMFFTLSAQQLALAVLFSLPCTFIAVFSLCYGSYTVLTVPRGQELAGKTLGLCRYLEDFSSFKDRSSADLPMWGRYLVYATAFGISAQALREFKKAQLYEPGDGASISGMDVLMYWSISRAVDDHFSGGHGAGGGDAFMGGFAGAGAMDFGSMFSDSMSSISSTIHAAAPSSSGSSGGSFSSGGFGGGGGGAGGGSFGGR